MLKLYSAHVNKGKVVLKEGLKLENGRYDTGSLGYGEIYSQNKELSHVDFENLRLQVFLDSFKDIEIEDGFVNNFYLLNPLDYKAINILQNEIINNATEEEKWDLFELFEKYNLNEEAALLFTNFLEFSSLGNTKKLAGRTNFSGMYLIYPKARFTLGGDYCSKPKTFELMQSEGLGKILSLSRVKR